MKVKHTLTLLSLAVACCLVVIAYLTFNLHQLRDKLDNPSTKQALSLADDGLSDPSSNGQQLDPFSNDWDPFASIQAARKRMDQMMSQMSAGHLALDTDSFGLASASPSIYLDEDARHYRVTVEVPKNYEIELNTALKDRRFTVSGELKNKKSKNTAGRSFQVVQASQFQRSFILDQAVDAASLRVEKHEDKFVATVEKLT